AWLGRYLNWLEGFLKRAAINDRTPRQLLAYQLLIFTAVSLVIGLLVGSPWLALGAGVLGAGMPLSLVRDRALRRESKLLRELPNALEVLSLCGEAGLSLEQGLAQYLAQRVGASHPLGEEFAKVLEQTRVGSSRREALAAMGQRLQLTDVSLFVTSVIQSEKFGTGMAKTLRQLSATLRDKQTQRTEKAVQELPVKMLLPLLLFILPVTFLIIFGPVLLSFFN
ncbi:MAG TPA: type II secretion system F family protein, partial [bacterium]|nr:type II secretion system F family protein [bacterium]